MGHLISGPRTNKPIEVSDFYGGRSWTHMVDRNAAAPVRAAGFLGGAPALVSAGLRSAVPHY